MIPAKLTCPSGWTREYYGYLMAEHVDRSYGRTMYTCVDHIMESVPGSENHTNGSHFYHTKAHCNECPGPECGAGIFMAAHFDRQYCGKCGLTYVYKKEDK